MEWSENENLVWGTWSKSLIVFQSILEKFYWTFAWTFQSSVRKKIISSSCFAGTNHIHNPNAFDRRFSDASIFLQLIMKSKYCSESVAAEYAWVFLEFENIVTFLSDNTPQKTLLLTLLWKKTCYRLRLRKNNLRS